ncbi:winged helix-turn-helix domain-containing protein [Thalassobaculum litoreum]|uniref:Molybdate transport system regulatory protein n=1 Tax=Thalassobaculum litoreum DSM 18839 TaxID=1123362 RepID=A0A8G2BLK2_9PROT|nr:LysR family transcriptional regulator [Thalassobaculum litoreum]SDG20597.1 molybdate transport system regulatory protein [Thalassobaculum litoreum DSM 18839]
MRPWNQTLGPRLRVVIAPNVAVGPGKADLLQGVVETGSIAAAGRRLGMSYKRAWVLVEGMKEDFGTPLVTTTRGGSARGGAELTELGQTVLDLYRRMEDQAAAATKSELAELQRLLALQKE